MSRIGILRQARRLARMPNPEARLASLDRIAAILEKACERNARQRALAKFQPRVIPSKRIYTRKGRPQ
jgi:crotonobetainyl-CoA:carnitine CoA-transferase CaiB-like acyl-CoA transferase